MPVDTCTFDFSKVLTDVTTMANVARLVENVGVTAYLGAAHLLSDPILLTTAGSILTIEARHQTILNVLNAGTAIPQAFDFALTPSEVLALAGPFISGCDLGVPANPSLTITNTGTVGIGTLLTFSSSAINGSTDVRRVRDIKESSLMNVIFCRSRVSPVRCWLVDCRLLSPSLSRSVSFPMVSTAPLLFGSPQTPSRW